MPLDDQTSSANGNLSTQIQEPPKKSCENWYVPVVLTALFSIILSISCHSSSQLLILVFQNWHIIFYKMPHESAIE